VLCALRSALCARPALAPATIARGLRSLRVCDIATSLGGDPSDPTAWCISLCLQALVIFALTSQLWVTGRSGIIMVEVGLLKQCAGGNCETISPLVSFASGGVKVATAAGAVVRGRSRVQILGCAC
jgi:hypothetical protein